MIPRSRPVSLDLCSDSCRLRTLDDSVAEGLRTIRVRCEPHGDKAVHFLVDRRPHPWLRVGR